MHTFLYPFSLYIDALELFQIGRKNCEIGALADCYTARHIVDTYRAGGIYCAGFHRLADWHAEADYIPELSKNIRRARGYRTVGEQSLAVFYIHCRAAELIFAVAETRGAHGVADRDTPVLAEYFIEQGEIRRVEGTPFDFRTMKPVAQDIEANDEQLRHGAGYDHCFVLNKHEEGELTLAARVKEPTSGRTMTVYTTEPGVQLYTDNWADGYQGQHGATFPRRSAICLECQHFPDSPNHPYFPSVVLNPGEEYTQKTIYQFGVEK